jgi:branched-chain amino acid transport system substrate-binding protein
MVRTKVGLQIAALTVCLAVVAACGSSSKTTGASPSASASTGGGSAPTGPPIKIGTIGGYSGFNSEANLPGRQALLAWVSYTNAHGGINGHPVQLIVKDDAAVPAKSLTAAKDLIENDHVVAIVGLNESGLEDAWAPYAASKKVPVIGGPANGESWLTNPNMFPGSGTSFNTVALTSNAALIAGKKSYGVIYCAEVPACVRDATFGKPVAQKQGLTWGGSVAVSASATTYTAQCLQLKAEGAEAVFSASSIDVATRFFANCTAQGYTPTPINDPRNWTPQQLKNPVWNGAILTSEGPLWFGDDPATQIFQAAMKKYQPTAIGNSNGPIGWAAAVVFGAAATAGIPAGATPTAAGILNGLYTLGPNYTAGGLIPPTTYTRGKPATQKPCGWYAKVVNGALTTPEGPGMVCLGN